MLSVPMPHDWLCLDCGHVTEIPYDADGNPNTDLNACPNCHVRNKIPADLTIDTVRVNITWHELRVLVMWSEQWAGIERGDDASRLSMQRVVKGIADRLHRQHLDKRALTFTGEIAELGAAFGKVEVHGIHLLPPDDEAAT